MGGHIFEDAVKRTDLDGIVVGHGEVMFATLLRRQADMRACLSQYRVTEFPQGADKFGPGAIARGLHTVRTSSRTKCRRMIPGRSGLFSSK